MICERLWMFSSVTPNQVKRTAGMRESTIKTDILKQGILQRTQRAHFSATQASSQSYRYYNKMKYVPVQSQTAC